MAFNRLMLTTDGKTLYAKAQQGKPLQFTRVGIGTGAIGGGSLVNRTSLITEKMSLLIDIIQVVNENETAIVTTLKNDSLAEGFYFREIGIFAKDPDTQQEKLYLYDNAGSDGEYIPDNQSGVIVQERLKFLLRLENISSVSFIPSGNPVYLSQDDISDLTTSESSLWSSQKTSAAIQAAITTAAADATAKANAAQTASIPLTKKGTANGVAELDSSGKVPSTQLPSYVDDVLEYADLAAFPVSGETGKIYVTLDANKTYRWSGSAYVEISQGVALGETFATAYRGDRGKAAYDHSQTAGNPHGTTAAQVGAATPADVQATSSDSLIRDLKIMMSLALGTSNMDAVADLLADATRINAGASSGYAVSNGVLAKITAHAVIAQSTDNGNTFTFGTVSTKVRVGAPFTTTKPATLSAITVKIKTPTATPTDNLYMQIVDLNAPLAVIATSSNTIAGNQIANYFQNFTFNFNQPLEANKTYLFMVARTTPSDTKYYELSGYTNAIPGFLTYYTDSSNQFSTNANPIYFTIGFQAPPPSAVVIWNPITTTAPLDYVAVSAIQTMGTGTITYYVSRDGVTWIQILALDTAQAVNFTASKLYLKAVITGDASIDAVAWGGY